MNILAIDTSSPVASVAFMSDGKLVAEYIINNGKTHSQIVVPLISDMLSKAGADFKSIDVFATSLGPGSFTGLRIGVATAKTFAQAESKKIIGVSALDGLFSGVADKSLVVCPIIDARRGNVYNAIYENGEKVTSDRLVSLADVLRELDGKKTVFLGDGVLKHREMIVNSMGSNAVFLPEHLSLQRASSVAYLANCRTEKNDFDDIYSLEPIYIRPSQAERELNGDKD